jgi:hypothetical protein
MSIKYSLEFSPRSERIDLDHDEERDYGLLTLIAARDSPPLRRLFARH